MAMPEGVNTLAGRLATFEGSRRLPKRRASSAKKKGANSQEWPHQSPTAEQLAKAGFFYQPTTASNDNVQCFCCQSQIDGWDQEDIPAVEHYKLASHCGWAVNQYINHQVSEGDVVEEDPLGETLMEARRATFMDSWPYEKKKGWKPQTKKMVEAGWCYNPSPEYNDETTCFYCNLSVDGWEPKDDPKEEHRRRSPDCAFFQLVDQFASSRKSKRGKSGRASKASTKSRVSTQSDATALANDPPSMLSLNTAAAEDDTVLTNATTTSTTSKGGRKKGAAKASTRKGGSRSKKAANTSAMDVDETVTDAPSAVEEPAAPPAKATRGKKRNTAQSEATNDSTINAAEPPRRTGRARATKNTRNTRRMSDDESQLHTELEDAIRRASSESKPKPTRGTKRTSDGVAKADNSSIVILEDPLPPVKPSTVSKATKAKKGTKRTTKTKEAQSSQIDVEMADAPEEPVKPAPKAKATRKGKKAKSPTPAPSPSPEPELEKPPTSEPNYEEDFDDDIEVHDTNLEDFPAPPSSAAKAPLASPEPEPEPEIEPEPELEPDLEPEAQGTPQPQRAKLTPSPSPQSSDAENVPPSARPPTHPASIQKIQESSARRPLGELASTPPALSPSKRNIIAGGLSSAQPWAPVDLETVFLMPEEEEREFRRLHGFATDALDQENLSSKDPAKLDAAIARVQAALTADEKRMTVDQWIRHNAALGEQRLRAECERMVSVFEEQGNRALRAIEGIECVYP